MLLRIDFIVTENYLIILIILLKILAILISASKTSVAYVIYIFGEGYDISIAWYP